MIKNPQRYKKKTNRQNKKTDEKSPVFCWGGTTRPLEVGTKNLKI
jgi:hypothetical protein